MRCALSGLRVGSGLQATSSGKPSIAGNSCAGPAADVPMRRVLQATSNGEVTQPRLNADLVGDLLALDDAPSTAGNATAAQDLLADLLGDPGPGLSGAGTVSGGSQVPCSLINGAFAGRAADRRCRPVADLPS